jgi:hypothetical protein
MLIDKMRAPHQLRWSPSLLRRPGLILFVGESQKEGQLSTNYIFWEGGGKPAVELWDCCRAHHSPKLGGPRGNYSMLTHLSSWFTRWSYVALGDLWLFHPNIVGANVDNNLPILSTLTNFSLASVIFRLAFTSVARPPGKQCMIAGWFFLSLILRVMELPMTMVFNLSELMVGGFNGSDPVTGGGEIGEGLASDWLVA